jgi:hypothetical protein
MTPTSPSHPTPEEARDLLARAESLGSSATAAASWPQIAFLLSFGAATSMGTLAMGLSTGSPYVVALVAMLAWALVLVLFMFLTSSSSRKGFRKRWGLYIGLWTAAYALAIAVASSSQGTDTLAVCLSSGLIALVTIACAGYEARRGGR